jgi:hypothetical protein
MCNSYFVIGRHFKFYGIGPQHRHRSTTLLQTTQLKCHVGQLSYSFPNCYLDDSNLWYTHCTRNSLNHFPVLVKAQHDYQTGRHMDRQQQRTSQMNSVPQLGARRQRTESLAAMLRHINHLPNVNFYLFRCHTRLFEATEKCVFCLILHIQYFCHVEIPGVNIYQCC